MMRLIFLEIIVCILTRIVMSFWIKLLRKNYWI